LGEKPAAVVEEELPLFYSRRGRSEIFLERKDTSYNWKKGVYKRNNLKLEETGVSVTKKKTWVVGRNRAAN